MPLFTQVQTGYFGQGPPPPHPKVTLRGLLQMLKPVAGMYGSTDSGGSGPYKSSYYSISSLPNHTIYSPDLKAMPDDIKLPVMIWGNGAAVAWGGWFSRFLCEIASHGYFIVVSGRPHISSLFKRTSAAQMIDGIDWVYEFAGTGMFVNVDKTKIVVAGQSLGGIQAYSASLDERIGWTLIFNSGLLQPENRKLLLGLRKPIAYFCGGKTDIAYENCEQDYRELPVGLPAVKLQLSVGHMATYGDVNGGLFARAALAYLDWQTKADREASKLFLEPSESGMLNLGWKIESKGW